MIVFPLFGFIGDKVRKFIERCDLHRTRSGKLFFHIGKYSVREFPAIGSDYTFLVFSRRLYRVEISDNKIGNVLDRNALVSS